MVWPRGDFHLRMDSGTLEAPRKRVQVGIGYERFIGLSLQIVE
jgi:hypothetical protein